MYRFSSSRFVVRGVLSGLQGITVPLVKKYHESIKENVIRYDGKKGCKYLSKKRRSRNSSVRSYRG
jgi:hypothetical protein